MLLNTQLIGGTMGDLILVVDNEKSEGQLVVNMLSCVGLSCHLANSKEEAVIFYDDNSSKISLVLTDQCMPQMGDGTQLCEYVKGNNPEIPVLLMTGSRKEPGNEKYFKGFDYVISKPLDIDRLLALVKKHKLP